MRSLLQFKEQTTHNLLKIQEHHMTLHVHIKEQDYPSLLISQELQTYSLLKTQEHTMYSLHMTQKIIPK